MKRKEKERRGRKKDRKHGKREKVRIRIKHPGSLKKFGYSLSKPEKKRKKALKRAEKRYGKDETIKKLTGLKTLDRRKPREERKIDADLNGVEGRGRS